MYLNGPNVCKLQPLTLHSTLRGHISWHGGVVGSVALCSQFVASLYPEC